MFERVQRRLEQKDGKEGVRSYIRILQLLETYPLKDVETALKQALALDVVTEGAILHLVKRCVEKRPLNLVMDNHPAVPSVTVSMPDLNVYGKLGGGCPWKH